MFKTLKNWYKMSIRQCDMRFLWQDNTRARSGGKQCWDIKDYVTALTEELNSPACRLGGNKYKIIKAVCPSIFIALVLSSLLWQLPNAESDENGAETTACVLEQFKPDLNCFLFQYLGKCKYCSCQKYPTLFNFIFLIRVIRRTLGTVQFNETINHYAAATLW